MVADKLNKQMNSDKLRFKEEKAIIEKQYKAEIKSWKKDLGKANSKTLKLEKELANSKALYQQGLHRFHSNSSVSIEDIDVKINDPIKPTTISCKDTENLASKVDNIQSENNEDEDTEKLMTKEEVEAFKNDIMEEFTKALASKTFSSMDNLPPYKINSFHIKLTLMLKYSQFI